jgi:hypothetical protein
MVASGQRTKEPADNGKANHNSSNHSAPIRIPLMLLRVLTVLLILLLVLYNLYLSTTQQGQLIQVSLGGGVEAFGFDFMNSTYSAAAFHRISSSTNTTTTTTTTLSPENQTIAEELQSLFGPAPWRTSTKIPPWMKDYIAWHQAQRAQLTAANWRNQSRYLIVRCIANDDRCGGTADRLRPLPFYVLVAHHVKRVLLIWWEKPTGLEAFLQPPVDGLDWRLPPYMLEAADSFRGGGRADLFGMVALEMILNYTDPDSPAPPHAGRQAGLVRALSDRTIVTMRFQTHTHGSYHYNHWRKQFPFWHAKSNTTITPVHEASTEAEVEATFEDVFRDCWYSVFVPVPPIQERIIQEMQGLQLHRNGFQAIHIRSRYAKVMVPVRFRNMVQNSLHCLYEMAGPKASASPIYVSADHRSAVREALLYGRDSLGIAHMTARHADYITSLNETQAMEETSTLHLDRGTNHLGRQPHEWTTHDADEYYDTFVDVYMLSLADCLTFGAGNYGKWANLLSDDRHCELNHAKSNNCPRLSAAELATTPA